MIDKRAVGTGVVMVLAALGLVACAGAGPDTTRTSTAGTPTTDRPHPPTAARSYLAEGANDVRWVQLTAGSHPTGVVEELLGPSVAPGGTTTDWVYRLAGSIAGHTLTYTVTPISPGAPPATGTFTGTITGHSITIGRPLTDGSDAVLRAATQRQYDLAARYHTTAWNRNRG